MTKQMNGCKGIIEGSGAVEGWGTEVWEPREREYLPAPPLSPSVPEGPVG